MTSIIEINNLTKTYQLGHREKYYSLRDALARATSRVFGGRKKQDIFSALHGVTLSVAEGEVVGIIGKNGAGKSTLLKILSKITPPTDGYVTLQGRVGSLLEVGTGFHPELTGRENIYLSGAILGMTRKEINRKFHQIVAFAEINKFLDTPVKHYSSGMYVRLAFAVAAHLEPEILIVDEVLAVGDAEFQKKCLGKMNEVSHSGRTVLFVSHNMNAIRQLCTRVIWLEKGKVKKEGDPREITREYEFSGSSETAAGDGYFSRGDQHGKVWISSVELTQAQRGRTTHFRYGENIDMTVNVSDTLSKQIGNHYIVWELFDEEGRLLTTGDTNSSQFSFSNSQKTVSVSIGPLPLYTGAYSLNVGIGLTGVERLDTWQGDIRFIVDECDPFGSGHSFSQRSGAFFIPQKWQDK